MSNIEIEKENRSFVLVEGKEETVYYCDDCIKIKRIGYIKKNIEPILQKSGVPLRFLKSSFENYLKHTDADNENVSTLTGIQSTHSDPVLICGRKSGVGKTHLSVSLLRGLVLSGALYPESFYFISSPYLLLDIKNSFKDDSINSEKEIIKKYSSYKWLFIDDIGIEKCTDWALQVWYMIIDNRYSNLLPTVFTTNFAGADIASNLGSRIASRMSGGIVINVEGKDHRISK